MHILEILSKKWYIRFFLLWFTATGGYVLLQEALPKMIGAVVGAIYRTGLGMTILDSVVLDFIFSAAIWCFYAGVLLAFLTMIFVSFFHALLNSFAIFEKYFDFFAPFPFYSRPRPNSNDSSGNDGDAGKNYPFSLFLQLSYQFSVFFIGVTGSILHYGKHHFFFCERRRPQYGPPNTGILALFPVTVILMHTGFLLYGLISGFLFDFFIRNKDPFLLNSQSPQQLL